MDKKKVKYDSLDQRTHALKRPDMYIGSIENIQQDVYVADKDSFKISKKNISFNPGLDRIFIEVLSNAIDNVWRSKEFDTPCTKIKINIDQETGETSVWNDGLAIPTEKNPETGLYNVEMIFGQMLTSSNYNDEEERKTSGRNGLGTKCEIFGSIVPSYEGENKKIEDYKIGEKIIGPDGNPRTILDMSFGKGKMFEIIQQRGKNYIVNDEHILTLRMPDHKVIFWNSQKNAWAMLYLDQTTKSIKNISSKVERDLAKSKFYPCQEYGCEKKFLSRRKLLKHYHSIHPHIEPPKTESRAKALTNPEMTKEMIEARNKLVEISKNISDDNTIDISIKDYLSLNKTTQGRLSGFKGECVNWKKKDVQIDPYILGMWLGDGSSVGEHPFKIALSKYNLINNKHIPIDYIVNDRDTRLKLLAGFIDTDGSVSRDGTRIVISQGPNHEEMIHQLYFLVKSLGLSCYLNKKDVTYNYKDEKKKSYCFSLDITGDLEDIPTLLPRKKCRNSFKRDTLNTGPIKIRELTGEQKFVGLTIDGDQRYVMEDFTVTHNCTNIYSQKFNVKTIDPENEKSYEQTWEENMSKKSESKIKSIKQKTASTEVTWIPDFKRFGCKGYTDDILSVYYKHIIDAAMITKVSVYLNDTKIPVKSLSDYAKLYLSEEKKEESESEVDSDKEDEKSSPKKKSPKKRGSDCLLYLQHEGCEVVLTPSDRNDFDAISFVNGVETYEGGVHVDAWGNALFKPILDKINSSVKKGTSQLVLKDVKQFFRLFLNCSLVNPKFTSQEKTKLSHPKVTTNVENKHITNIMKWSVIEKIRDIIRSKELLTLKKTEKKKGFKKIDGYDPANNSGGKHSKDCTLILCEGLSAKTYAVMGIEVGAYGKKGRDWYGIYPLRGKILNTRNASSTSISKNREITDIIQALGLKIDVDYTDEKNFNELNYGRLMLLTDQDDDGIHISGLIINMFHHLFPTLLKRQDPFIVTMKTPLIRIYFKNSDKCFYSAQEYKKYLSEKNEIKGRIKYFKGLGTSNESEVKDTFGKKMVEYVQDKKTDDTINKVFHNKFSDVRKEWLRDFDPEKNTSLLRHENEFVSKMNFSDFMDHEMIKFSIDDCKRSLPNLMDGLKESQRKVLYAAFLKNLKHSGKTLKVAQLSGFVAEKTNYHHGEQNLFDTITKMANEFPGSNNIPLFFRDGQFGTRLSGGKDAANARYIFTKLEALTRLIFREEDDVLLERVEDDGELVEPKYYVPILPMILVNGCSGIGTGWSCDVPNFNPSDIISAIKIWLETNSLFEDDEKTISKIPELLPWYRGFTGKIEKYASNKFISYGKVEKDKEGVYVVNELPVKMWTEKFKDIIETLLEDKDIKGYKNYSTTDKVNFAIQENNNGIKCNVDTLKLKSTETTTNMTLFTEHHTIKKYLTVDEIIDSFCRVRYSYYIKRKIYILKEFRELLKYANNKYRFLSEVMDEKLIIQKRDEKDVIKELEEKGYDKKVTNSDEGEEGEEDKNAGSYRYLLDMKIRSFTKQKLDELKKEIDGLKLKIKEAEKINEGQMWIKDLTEFEEGYKKWENEISKKDVKSKKVINK